MCEIDRIFINVKKLTLKKKKLCYELCKNKTFYYESNRVKQTSTIKRISTIERIFTIEQISTIKQIFTIEQIFTIKQNTKIFEQYI